jgi:hypothetical protein
LLPDFLQVDMRSRDFTIKYTPYDATEAALHNSPFVSIDGGSGSNIFCTDVLDLPERQAVRRKVSNGMGRLTGSGIASICCWRWAAVALPNNCCGIQPASFKFSFDLSMLLTLQQVFAAAEAANNAADCSHLSNSKGSTSNPNSGDPSVEAGPPTEAVQAARTMPPEEAAAAGVADAGQYVDSVLDGLGSDTAEDTSFRKSVNGAADEGNDLAAAGIRDNMSGSETEGGQSQRTAGRAGRAGHTTSALPNTDELQQLDLSWAWGLPDHPQAELEAAELASKAASPAT